MAVSLTEGAVRSRPSTHLDAVAQAFVFLKSQRYSPHRMTRLDCSQGNHKDIIRCADVARLQTSTMTHGDKDNKVATAATPPTNPKPDAEINDLMTGAEYLESLRDAREVYIYGERVHDVTTHPAFRNAARSIMRLYDTLHDPAQRDLLTTVDDYGIRTHRVFCAEPIVTGAAGSAGCHRRLGAAELRLHGAHAGVQGRVYGQPRR